ncbi:LPS O-antigen length regulator [Yersinia intermedia]|jgi:LPS O-antigen subunit length determinant protein (WzzB/FepE family)|uniref:LPS O-antigen length regulator n=3 Tax=Yersinia intermedia TaxID=631 RepID=A0ABX6F894_YERIN|nr:LPS O-antigen length regulator Wzz(fepE) [Yersinia intermedia]EEQ20620.1 Chain length determinant family protein Wzz [Yersinia intermedia ATCC 29909]MDA5482819.1 LPS O-antigen length regulator Wzz(fepE) [Yersinia intermedia]OVZ73728.1 LPS O-antigen length regulator [Yersinia intermedia]QGR65457.1 LPS O-antigen length regulator [Yersinia intermedia]QGR70474.1 LPS O-antigen length regulator [Yersinia intermedia]
MNDKYVNNKVDTRIKSSYIISGTLPSKNEIDLFELSEIVFRSKTKIILITLIFLIGGFVFSYFLPQKWTSVTVIAPPGNEQMRVLDKITNSLTVLDIKLGITPAYLMSSFVQNFNSEDLREQYILNSDYFKYLIKNNTGDGFVRRELIGVLVNSSIGLVSLQPGNIDGGYKLSFSATTPEGAHELLQGYLDYIKTIVNNDINLKIQRAVDSAKTMAMDEYSQELLRAKNNQEVKINRLKNAYSIANSAGIKKPIYSSGSVVSNDPDFLILMGTDVLNSKLEIEKSITDLASINVTLFNRKLYLDKLNTLEIPKVDIVPFKYLQQPTEPATRDAPKRGLIIILFAIAGLIGSISFVLVAHFARARGE